MSWGSSSYLEHWGSAASKAPSSPLEGTGADGPKVYFCSQTFRVTAVGGKWALGMNNKRDHGLANLTSSPPSGSPTVLSVPADDPGHTGASGNGCPCPLPGPVATHITKPTNEVDRAEPTSSGPDLTIEYFWQHQRLPAASGN